MHTQLEMTTLKLETIQSLRITIQRNQSSPCARTFDDRSPKGARRNVEEQPITLHRPLRPSASSAVRLPAVNQPHSPL